MEGTCEILHFNPVVVFDEAHDENRHWRASGLAVRSSCLAKDEPVRFSQLERHLIASVSGDRARAVSSARTLKALLGKLEIGEVPVRWSKTLLLQHGP